MIEVEVVADATNRMLLKFDDSEKAKALAVCAAFHNAGFTVTAFEVTRNKDNQVTNLTAVFNSQWEDEDVEVA